MRYTGPFRVEKAINTLAGIVAGIAADHVLKPLELDLVANWLEAHVDLQHRHPFSEVVASLRVAISDGILTAEERDDLIWLCARFRSAEYVNAVTADMQELHGVLAGIAADGEIVRQELHALEAWLESHQHLRTLWPYDEVETLLMRVVDARQMGVDQQKELLQHFSQYGFRVSDQTLDAFDTTHIAAICMSCPEIVIPEASFCITGASARMKRSEMQARIADAGGIIHENVRQSTNYLIVGADGNPCWAYACYGRKVEQAVKFRRAGFPVQIVHEHDLHDALADL